MSLPTAHYDVKYKGEPGRLTLANKFFHYEANIIEATIKCSWARVEKRQLSPPGADSYLIKLVLVSGKTAVFEVETLPILLRLVKDVKARMEANKPEIEAGEEEEKKADDDDTESEANATARKKNRFSVNTEYMSMKDIHKDPSTENSTQEEDIEQAKPSSNYQNNRQNSKRRMNNSSVRQSTSSRRSNRSLRKDSSKRRSHPPVLVGQDEMLAQAHDKRDDSRQTICYCPWESIWCWLCLALFLAIIGLIITLIVIFVILDKDGNGNGSSFRPKDGPLCKDTNEDLSQCPPDEGLEYRYGIRSVEYVWGPDFVRLEYYISDYILDDSVNFFVMDGVECRGSDDQLVDPENNPWLKMELVDGAPNDGGANYYNEGRGTRQFDVDLEVIGSSNQLAAAPFYFPNTAGINKAFLRICVNFQIYYNKLDGYEQEVEVNYIENALQLNMDVSDLENPIIDDVQIKTITRPNYS